MPLVMQRIKKVHDFRLASKSTPTQKLAAFPTEFHTKFHSTNRYLAMPQVSSERRDFIPIAFLGGDVLCGDKLRLVTIRKNTNSPEPRFRRLFVGI